MPEDGGNDKSPEAPKAKPLRRGAPKGGWVGNRTVMQADKVAITERKARRLKAFDLEVQGTSRSQIARILGISIRQVNRDLDKVTHEVGHENVIHQRRVYTARLEEAILDEKMAINAIRPMVRTKVDSDGKPTGATPDLEASRTLALHNRTLRGLVAELASVNGVKIQKHEHEHTGAGGGPIVLSMDDILSAVTAASDNSDAVQSSPHDDKPRLQ